MKEKLAIFISSFRGGGAEKVAVNLANEFVKCGKSVEIITISNDGPLKVNVSKKVKIISFNKSRAIYALPNLITYLRSEKPSAILTVMDHINIIGILGNLLSQSNTKICISIHTNLHYEFIKNSSAKKKAMLFFIKSLYQKAHKIISVSKSGAKDISMIANIPIDKIDVIYNPILSDDFFKISNKKVEDKWINTVKLPLVISAGRLSEEKDFITLIRAFKLVLNEIDCRLMIFGEGDQKSKLECEIKKLGLCSKIKLKGFVDNLPAYINHSDLFVMTSKVEGFGNVLVEAMALNVPIVSTDCPTGPREILENSDCLASVGDVEGVAKKMLDSLKGGKALNYSPDRVNDFNINSIVNSYLNLLR